MWAETYQESNPMEELFWESVEQMIDAFEADYRAGRAGRLTDYLPTDQNAFLSNHSFGRQSDNGNAHTIEQLGLRRLALIELVKVDTELRWRDDRGLRLDQYVATLSELGSLSELPAELVFEVFNAQQANCETATAREVEKKLESFCESFPDQRDEVYKLADQFQISQSSARRGPPDGLEVGQQHGDFELLRRLGSGGFAHVFLARQKSLERVVALKISANRGNEARTMASLEHDHVVQVFSETIDEPTGRRWLCMQYVPGTTLGHVLRSSKNRTIRPNLVRVNQPLTGTEIVNAIDESTVGSARLQLNALRDREALVQADETQAVCLIGLQVVDALEFAHRNGVLHRDIKPDNILFNPFGQCFLSDFNLALNRNDARQTDDFGGCLPYMAPEHLAAFQSDDPKDGCLIDARSDIFSLGAVLFECIVGEPPSFFATQGKESGMDPSANAANWNWRVKKALDQPAIATVVVSVVEKCLAYDPSERFQVAAELQTALRAGKEWQTIHRSLPENGRLLGWCDRYVVSAMLFAAILPNVFGSLVNIAYNSIYIMPRLVAEQEIVFQRVLIGYNVIVYPACIVFASWQLRWFLSFDRRATDLEQRQRDRTRSNLLDLPSLMLLISCVGWFSGGLLFPAAIHCFSYPLEFGIFAHFVVDFAISGLIALTYLYFGVQCLMLRTLYVPLLAGVENPQETAKRELANIKRRLRIAQMGAGVIPLCGALLLVFLGPQGDEAEWMFRCLVLILIGAGMIGFSISVSVVTSLGNVVNRICDSHD